MDPLDSLPLWVELILFCLPRVWCHNVYVIVVMSLPRHSADFRNGLSFIISYVDWSSLFSLFILCSLKILSSFFNSSQLFFTPWLLEFWFCRFYWNYSRYIVRHGGIWHSTGAHVYSGKVPSTKHAGARLSLPSLCLPSSNALSLSTSLRRPRQFLFAPKYSPISNWIPGVKLRVNFDKEAGQLTLQCHGAGHHQGQCVRV